ncbi:MAG: RadC family protein [Phenylobacterium sp.]
MPPSQLQEAPLFLSGQADGPPDPSPHAGHRARLRLRARKGGPGALPDYELLELLLFRSLPRGDVKPLAKALLVRFDSLAGVLGAPLEDLVRIRGLGEQAALDLKLAHEAAVRISREPVARRAVITSWTQLSAYLRTAMAHEPREQFRVLFLDRKNQPIADEAMHEGTVDHAPVYPREVVRRALELSARALSLAPTHPAGAPTPTQAALAMTREVIEAAKVLRLSVHDHVIVGRDGLTSFRAQGLI